MIAIENLPENHKKVWSKNKARGYNHALPVCRRAFPSPTRATGKTTAATPATKSFPTTNCYYYIKL